MTTATHPLQTTFWTEFRRKWGNEVVETKYGFITLHKIPFIKLKVGMFIKGPKPTQGMLDDLKKLAKDKNLIFIKLEPSYVKTSEGAAQQIIKLLKSNGCVPGKTLFTPSTFWIDLTKSEEELLKSFHPKTRYNIRLAQKQGVTIEEKNSDQAFEQYITLTKETVQRQGFYAHTERYHRLMWQTLHTDMRQNGKFPIAHLLTAKYKKEVITTWILFVWHDFLYYPYGASSDKYKNVMANNLMMWEAIKFGKKLGLSSFDLWGREPGKGFTRFKEGYHPQVIELLGTWDLVSNKWLYYLYKIAEEVRWKILRAKSLLKL